MSRKFTLTVLALGLIFGLCPPAHAYLDPGTGMTFASGIGGVVAAIFAACFSVIAVTFKRWVGFLRSIGSAVKRLFRGRPSA